MRSAVPPLLARSAPFPSFFIVGVGRSGTTLARAIITGHPTVEVPPETGFLPTLLRLSRAWWGRDGVRAEVFTRLVFANGRMPRAGLRRDELSRALVLDPPSTPADAISRLYGLFATGPATRYVGDKTPGYVEHARLLATTFPQARFIHMVRHPLDVVASLTRQPWGPNDPLAAAWLWLRGIEAATAAHLPATKCLAVRLEDLVTNADDAVTRMADHLGISVHVDMMQFRERAELISHQNIHPEAHVGLSRPLTPTHRWQHDLTARDAARVWPLVAEAAHNLGYEGPPAPYATVKRREAALRLARFEATRSWRRGRTVFRLIAP